MSGLNAKSPNIAYKYNQEWCSVKYLGHYGLLFTFRSISKENLVGSYIKYRFTHDH